MAECQVWQYGRAPYGLRDSTRTHKQGRNKKARTTTAQGKNSNSIARTQFYGLLKSVSRLHMGTTIFDDIVGEPYDISHAASSRVA